MWSAVNQLVSSWPPRGRTWRSTSTAKFPHCNTKKRHSHRLLRGTELTDNKENQSVGDWQRDKPQRPPASSNITPGISLLSTPSCSSVQPPLYQPFHKTTQAHLRFPLSQCKTGVFVRWAGKCITVASHQAAGSKMSKIAQSHVRIRKRWITSYQNGFQTSSDLKTQIMYIILLQQGRGCLTCCYIFLRLAWLRLTHERKSGLLQRTNACWSHVNFASPWTGV